MTSLPPPSTLPHSSDSTLTHVLDLLFEPSPPLHALTLPVLRSSAFPSYDALIAAVHALLTALATSDEREHVDKVSKILCAHPRLGEKKVESEQSAKEQAGLQGGDEESEMLEGLNEVYEEVFPGLRYV
jgi:2-oxo-4-hydroxy-4-carboxy--5-ureidoimidazoline (OHCU) decarboxylase